MALAAASVPVARLLAVPIEEAAPLGVRAPAKRIAGAFLPQRQQEIGVASLTQPIATRATMVRRAALKEARVEVALAPPSGLKGPPKGSHLAPPPYAACGFHAPRRVSLCRPEYASE